MSPPLPWFRATRAVVFATVCVLLASLGHALAARETVPAWAVLAGFGGVLAVTLLLAGHERSLPTIAGGLLGGQFALHTLFAGATAPALHHAASGPAGPVPGHGSGAAMTFAHTAAALVCALWLWRGERAAWSLARRLAAVAERPVRLLLALAAALPPAARPRVVPVDAAALIPPVGRALWRRVRRRGPPAVPRALPGFQ